MVGDNDRTLMEAWVLRRDAAAFDAVARRHAAMVYATCRRILRSAADAEDVAQESFEVLARTPHGPQTHLGAWLHRVATNRALMRRRADVRRRDLETRYVGGRGDAVEPDWDDLQGHVDAVLAELPEAYRVPLVAHYLEGQTHGVIAIQLGVSRQTVTHRIDKGVNLARKALRKRGIAVGGSALAALFSTHLAEAAVVPDSLAASFGRIAAAVRPATAAPTLIAASAHSGLLVKSIIGVVAAGALLTGVWSFVPGKAPAPLPTSPSPVAQPQTSVPAPAPASQVPAKTASPRSAREPARPEAPTQPMPASTGDAVGMGPVAAESILLEPVSTDLGPLVPLPIELPQPAFGGTPLSYFGLNLEPKSFKKRAPFLAPAGAENVARGMVVTSSAAPAMGKLEQITDGDKEAYERSVVEIPAGRQWVQIDLGQDCSIYAILVWHFFASDRVYFDMVVQVSDDPEFLTGVSTVYNNDHDNSSGLGVGTQKEYIEGYEGRLIDAKGVRGRYVRLHSKGNTTDEANHYIEVEMFGKPAPEE